MTDKSSSSVSHLVENEISLASALPTTSPTAGASSSTDRRLKLSQNSVNDIQISPMDLNEIICESASMSASADGVKKSNYNSLIMSDKHDNNSVSISTPSNISTSATLADISVISQNVYSNIPPSSPSVPNILKNAAADHVYSNIDETITGMGSSYMTDNIDLDLDDPLLTSSFSKSNKEKPNTNQLIYNTSVSSEMQPNNSANKAISSFSSSSSTTGTQITSIELKNVLKNVVLQQQAPAMAIESSPAILSPSSLRQTMIDTALDLDSLDGSSIENNSQVGLMSSKTALV